MNDTTPGAPLEADSVEKGRAFAQVNAALFDADAAPYRLGRYVLLERLGAGAMGIVFSAYDPQLDRRIALKLLRRGGSPTEQARAELLREARAMARLNHPNVVTVHEVGEEGDRIFFTMEFVEAGTLRSWMQSGPRPWAEVIRLFVAAGRGVAAAHAANLVHRDFKPENVLVTEAGLPLVADFGLARVGPHATTSNTTTDPDGWLMTSGGGGCVGTPAYMAPEVFLGRTADALSDQFSFGVALFEALYGQRPFVGPTRLALETHVVQGQLEEPSQTSQVPTAVRRVLDQVLQVDPDARFDSMDDLLAALEVLIKPARRGRWGLGALALASAAGAWALAGATEKPDERCSGGMERAAEVWTTARGTDLARGLDGPPEPADAFVEQGDAFARAWADAHRETCLDTVVRKVQTEAEMERRMRCLDGRLRGFAGALTAIESQPGVEAAAAKDALEVLASVEECEEPQRGGLMSPPALWDQALEIEEQLARARALEQLHDPEEGMKIAAEQVEKARALGEGRLLARALTYLATMEVRSNEPGRATEHIYEARLEAERAGLDLMIVRLLMLSAGDAVLSDDVDRVRRDLDVARAVLHRHGGDLKYEGALAIRMGTLAYSTGDLEEAVEHYQRGLRALHEYGGEIEAEVGALVNLGLALRDLGRNDEALTAIREAHARCSATFGPNNPELPAIGLHIAMVLDEQARYDEALVELRAALALSAETRGADSADGIQIHAGLGLVHARLGHHEDALRHSRECLRILERLDLGGHPDAAMCLAYAGDALVGLGRAPEAVADYQRAVRINETVYGPNDPDLAEALLGLARAQRAAGQTADAGIDGAAIVQNLERALQIRLDAKLPPLAVAEVRHALAAALKARDASRSAALARTALVELRDAGASTHELIDELRELAGADDSVAREHASGGMERSAVATQSKADTGQEALGAAP